MVNIDGFIESIVNVGILLTTLGVLGELRNRRASISSCLTANANVGLSLLAMGTTAKIYKIITD